MLAVLKAGGAYVPLDPEYPAGRLSDMVSDADLRVLLLQGAAVGALPLQDGVTRILLELDERGDEASALASSSAVTSVSTPALDDLHADHLAYMIYTSGSTGQPKGAANTHAGLVNRAGLDAGCLRADGRRRGAAEDAVQLRRLGVGVLLAADRRRAAGGGGARRAPRSGAYWSRRSAVSA